MDPLEEKYQLHCRSNHPRAADKSGSAPQKQLLGHLPKEFFLQILPSTPTTGVLGYELVWLATPHTMAVILGIPHSKKREAVKYIPHNAGTSKVGQGYQTFLGKSHSQLMLPSVPTKSYHSRENNVIIEKSYLTK